MLIRVLFKNFLSYYEGTEFNLLPNIKRTRLNNHIYSSENNSVLKISAVYGANGAGKSNLLKGVNLLKRFVMDKHFLQDEDFYNDYRFLLAKENKSVPISIALEFTNKNITFYYHVDILNNKISKEELFFHDFDKNEDVPIFICTYVGDRRELRVYDENGVEDKEYIDKKTTILLEKNATSSILSLQKEFPIISNDMVDIAYQWFDEKLKVIPIGFNIPVIIDFLDNSKIVRDFINRKISDMSLGVSSIEVKKQKLSDIFSRKIEKNDEIRNSLMEQFNSLNSDSSFVKMNGNRAKYVVCKEGNQPIVKELVFNQKGIGGYEEKMSVESQSEGTISLLTKLSILFDLLNNDSAIFIDEIENSLHPMLIEKFIKLFLDDSTSRGQLIFTTHEVKLLDQKLLRSDEVWFTEKIDGASKLYSLNDFKEHSTIDIEKGYLAGRYGAIPFFGSDEILND